jgi:hypothetical protein
MANIIAIPFVLPFKRLPTSSAGRNFEALGTHVGRRSIEPKQFNATRLGEHLPGLELTDSRTPLNVVVLQQDICAAPQATGSFRLRHLLQRGFPRL